MNTGGEAEAGPVVLSNWAFERIGRVLVLCSIGPKPPPERDFEVWIQRLLQSDFDQLLIYSEGGSPSVTQRARIADAWKSQGRVAHVALMTESKLARGFLTAIGWLIGGKMKPFPLTELNAALVWVDATNSSREIAEAIARLRTGVVSRAVRSA